VLKVRPPFITSHRYPSRVWFGAVNRETELIKEELSRVVCHCVVVVVGGGGLVVGDAAVVVTAAPPPHGQDWPGQRKGSNGAVSLPLVRF
jgi:hypothetical protein